MLRDYAPSPPRAACLDPFFKPTKPNLDSQGQP